MSNVLEILNQIAAEQDAAHPEAKRLERDDEAGGVWTEESLERWFVLVQARHPEFTFTSTHINDGWMVWCPGNTTKGWNDREAHTDKYTEVCTTTLVWLEEGKGKFVCKRSHCDAGAAHGKKTWGDFLAYYDPDHSLEHKALGSPIEIEDEDVGALRREHLAEIDAAEEPEPPEEPLPEPTEAEADLYDMSFPEAAMYGALGDAARATEMPLGLAYPAVVGTYSTMAPHSIMLEDCHTNLYVGLVMPVGGGKGMTMFRARRVLGIQDDLVETTNPASDRGLLRIIGGKVLKQRGKEPEHIPGPTKKLFHLEELNFMLAKAKVDNSTLAPLLCALWDKDEAGSSVKEGAQDCVCRVSMVGGLPFESPSDISAIFGAASQFGLFSRFVLGYSATRFKYRFTKNGKRHVWKPQRVGMVLQVAHTDVTVTDLSDAAAALFDSTAEAWEDMRWDASGRVRQNAVRFAVLSSAANGEAIVSEACMRAALRFAEWQIRLRRTFLVVPSQNPYAELEAKIVAAWRSPTHESFYLSRMRSKYVTWADNYGTYMVTRALEAMVKGGRLLPMQLVDADGNPKLDGDGKPKYSVTRFYLAESEVNHG